MSFNLKGFGRGRGRGGSVQSEFESETINDQSVPDARHFYLSFSMRRLSYIIAIPNMILIVQ